VRLSNEQFDKLFDEFRRFAFRLEARAAYNIPQEKERIAAYRNGYVPPQVYDYPWRDFVEEATRAGKKMQRVHMVTPPLSEYVMWQSEWAYKHTIPVGEDVRILDTSITPSLDLPNEDFWILDDTVVRLDFNPDDTFAGPSLIENRLAEYMHYRKTALENSIPFQRYWVEVCHRTM
jgi:hypothetical protein